MDDEFTININFKEGTIRTNREPMTEEEKIRLKLVEQDLAIRDMIKNSKNIIWPERKNEMNTESNT
jgi:hypothetical protein